MEKFREFIIELAETCPNAPNPASKTLFQDRLNKWFSEYKTPDHPPYSAMIERALSELNEKNGSTGDEISQFIIKEYDALPWAHLTLLESHLDKLNKSGNIVLTRGKRYKLAEENSFLISSTKDKKKKRKRKSRWAWERDINKRRKKRNQPKGNRFDLIEEHKGSYEKLTENDLNNEKNYTDGMMAVTDMENYRDTPQELEINLSQIMNGHICGADKEEKQEEGQTHDNQLAVSSPERPPGFESTVVENFSDSGIFLRTCLCPQEQSFVVGERGLDLPIDDKRPDSPREPSVHELSVSEKFLKITKLSDSKGSSEAHEMAVSVQERIPKSVEVHETVSNTSVSSDRRRKNSKCPKAEAISNIQFPKLQSGIVSVSASAEEISTSERMERQQTHWGLHSPKTVNFTGPDISPNSNDHQLPWLKLSDVEMPQDQREESVSSPNPEQHLLNEKPHCDLLEADILKVAESVTIERKPNEIKVYSRRTNTRPEQSQNAIQVVRSDVNLLEPNAIVDSRNSSMSEHEPRELLRQPPMESDVNLLEPNAIVVSRNSSTKEHETRELLHQSSLVQGEALQDKPSHDEDVSLIDVLEPEHQPEEFQKTVLKRRGRPPKHKPIIAKKSDVNLFEPNAIVDSQNSSMNEHETRELLQQQPLVSGEALRDKPSCDEDASLIEVLQPEHQPEECQNTVLKRRGRPPKRKTNYRDVQNFISFTISGTEKCKPAATGATKAADTTETTKVEADVTVRGNSKSIHSPKAEATTTDDLLLLDVLVPKLRRGRPPKC